MGRPTTTSGFAAPRCWPSCARSGSGALARSVPGARGPDARAEKEFFIRKAIGWVLREAGKRRPGRGRGLAGAAHASGQRGDHARGGEVPAAGRGRRADGRYRDGMPGRLKYRGVPSDSGPVRRVTGGRAGAVGTCPTDVLFTVRTGDLKVRAHVGRSTQTAAIGGDRCCSRSSSAWCWCWSASRPARSSPWPRTTSPNATLGGVVNRDATLVELFVNGELRADDLDRGRPERRASARARPAARCPDRARRDRPHRDPQPRRRGPPERRRVPGRHRRRAHRATRVTLPPATRAPRSSRRARRSTPPGTLANASGHGAGIPADQKTARARCSRSLPSGAMPPTSWPGSTRPDATSCS